MNKSNINDNNYLIANFTRSFDVNYSKYNLLHLVGSIFYTSHLNLNILNDKDHLDKTIIIWVHNDDNSNTFSSKQINNSVIIYYISYAYLFLNYTDKNLTLTDSNFIKHLFGDVDVDQFYKKELINSYANLFFVFEGIT